MKEYQISPTLKVVGTSNRRGINCAKFQIWAEKYNLTDLESLCCFLYHIYVENGNGIPQYGISYQDLLFNTRNGFEKLRAYKESIINL